MKAVVEEPVTREDWMIRFEMEGEGITIDNGLIEVRGKPARPMGPCKVEYVYKLKQGERVRWIRDE